MILLTSLMLLVAGVTCQDELTLCCVKSYKPPEEGSAGSSCWKPQRHIGLLFGEGHSVIRKGADLYVIQCKQVDVTIRTSGKCTHEVPVTYKGTEMFVDPFSLILQSMATPLDSDIEASPR